MKLRKPRGLDALNSLIHVSALASLLLMLIVYLAIPRVFFSINLNFLTLLGVLISVKLFVMVFDLGALLINITLISRSGISDETKGNIYKATIFLIVCVFTIPPGVMVSKVFQRNTSPLDESQLLGTYEYISEEKGHDSSTIELKEDGSYIYRYHGNAEAPKRGRWRLQPSDFEPPTVWLSGVEIREFFSREDLVYKNVMLEVIAYKNGTAVLNYHSTHKWRK